MASHRSVEHGSNALQDRGLYCCICGDGPERNPSTFALRRLNKKGVPGIWACPGVCCIEADRRGLITNGLIPETRENPVEQGAGDKTN